MILVILGTHFLGFERLAKKMDELAGKMNEEIVIQLGNTKYSPKKAAHFKYKSYDELRLLMKSARIVVCQGAMTILDALILGIPVIAVPRLAKFGEALNDHQYYFAKKLESMGLILLVEDISKLDILINKSVCQKPKSIEINPILISKIKNQINIYNNIFLQRPSKLFISHKDNK